MDASYGNVAELTRPEGDPPEGGAQLRQFLSWLTPLIFGFAVVETIAARVFDDGRLLAVGTMIFGYGLCLVVAIALLRSGRILGAVAVTGLGLVPPDVAILVVEPSLLATLILVPFVAVAMALPFVRGRSSMVLLVACWTWSVGLGVLSEIVTPVPGRNGLYGGVFRVAALGAASGMALLLLSQFRARITEAAARERETARRLRRLDEMRSAFLAAVSHDLRTPLTVILGAATTMGRPSVGEGQRAQLAEGIVRNSRKLRRLLDDLLDLDRLELGVFESEIGPADLELLVAEAVGQVDLPPGRVVTVEVEPVRIAVDATQVERIVENLVMNSLRHTGDDVPVWVKVRPVPDGGLIVVEDAGSGVRPDLRASIFRPFARGDASGQIAGSGIGLSLVARFAELHGGRAWVEERPGGGAAFHVFLPTDPGERRADALG
jgi:signal transduction histidine kinase